MNDFPLSDHPHQAESVPSHVLSAIEQAVQGDMSLSRLVTDILADSAPDGSIPLHRLATRFIEEYGEDSRLAPDEVRQHLANSLLPRLAGAGFIEPRDGSTDPESLIQVRQSLWAELSPQLESVLAALRLASEQPLKSKSAHRPKRPAPSGSILSTEGLVKVYRGRKVVYDVALNVQQGEIVGLLGPNGAGKTTTFYMLVGLIDPLMGTIRLDGKDITRMPMYQRARRGIGYLSQEPSIFRKLTVEENILTILETLPLSSAERSVRLESLLDELKIKHLRKSKAYQLSGGERRRLEITRALVTQPKFMMLDEPFAGVDPIAVHDIQSIVADLRTRGIGVLISDHNVEQTLDIVDRAYIMFEGQVKVSGTVRELVFDDVVAKDYLGPTLSARLRARFLADDELNGTESEYASEHHPQSAVDQQAEHLAHQSGAMPL